MNEEELMRQIHEKVERWNKYEELNRIANHKNFTELDDVVNLINDIFKKHGIVEKINKTQIGFSSFEIGNIHLSDKKISNLIFDKIYPRPFIKRFSHYTKFNTGISILENNEFWLFNLLQNFKDEEFRLFYREHNIDGYEVDANILGVNVGYKSLMSEIFALCLTSEENNSSTLWSYFADNGTGMKLTFEIQSKIPDFREVYYSNINEPQQIDLLKDLFVKIKQKFNYQFNFTNISKIGAFYIKGDFENEKEFRFLIKRNSDSYDAWKLQPITFQDDISYIKLPFQSKYANFKLVKVEKGANCSQTEFEKIIPLIKSKYGNIEIY